MCTLTPNNKPFNDNTLSEINFYYNNNKSNNSFDINNFAKCLYLYNYNTNPQETNNIKSLNNFKNILEKTTNTVGINENTISLYNNDMLYIILKSSLFIILGIVYFIYIKKITLVNTLENLKNKTFLLSGYKMKEINPQKALVNSTQKVI